MGPEFHQVALYISRLIFLVRFCTDKVLVYDTGDPVCCTGPDDTDVQQTTPVKHKLRSACVHTHVYSALLGVEVGMAGGFSGRNVYGCSEELEQDKCDRLRRKKLEAFY